MILSMRMQFLPGPAETLRQKKMSARILHPQWAFFYDNGIQKTGFSYGTSY